MVRDPSRETRCLGGISELLQRSIAAVLAMLAVVIPGCAADVPAEQGIPVMNQLVIDKCGSCHVRDAHGNMQRISWQRTTPEGWQEIINRMVAANGVSLTAPEGRAMIQYLSDGHGLAPEEARAVAYDVERRARDEDNVPNEALRRACARCHTFAKPLSWRRSEDEWKQLIADHAKRFHLPANNEAATYLAKAAPLHTPEWVAWNTRARGLLLAGRWLITASAPGRGKFYGEMRVEATGGDAFTYTVGLTSIQDGSIIVRSGRSVVYGGYAWRGRSNGSAAKGASPVPDDPASEAREVLWVAPDQSTIEGRWFWGQYQEFGFDVKMRRAPADAAALLLSDHSALKTGSQNNRVRLIGDHLPAALTPGDLNLGPGVTVQRVVSSTANEVVADVDVAPDAVLGKHDVSVHGAVLPAAIAVYDRVDYIVVTPPSAMAAFSDDAHARGYLPFEAIGYQRGADGKAHTPDDVELGPVDVTWGVQAFYSAEGAKADFVGAMTASGLFVPTAESPKANFDVWVIATAKSDTDANGRPLSAKSYLVVTVPVYSFNGQKFVRDLNRWVEEGQ